MAKKKIHWFDEHPEIKSAGITFLTAFIPIFLASINTVDVGPALESGALWGIIGVAIRMALKAGINALIAWFASRYK